MAKEKTKEELLARMRGTLGVDTLGEEPAEPAVQSAVVMQPEKPAETQEARKTRGQKDVKARLCVAVYPTLMRDLKRISYIKRESVSETVGGIIEKFIKANQAALEEFDSLPLQVQKKVDEQRMKF